MVLWKGSSIITRNEFKSLRSGGWIYNTIINVYCKLAITLQVYKV